MSDIGFGGFGSDPFDELLARFLGSGSMRRPSQRVDIGRLMSDQARELVTAAGSYAVERGDTDLDNTHLLWAALKVEPTRGVTARAGADPDALASHIEQSTPQGGARRETGPTGATALELTPAAKRALLDAHQAARAMGSSYIGPEHILLALSANPDNPAGKILRSAHLDPQALQREITATEGRTAPGGRGPGDTPNLDRFGRDLTELAGEGKLDPVIGRDDEIEQTIEILSRRAKNNPVLIGDAGVGKTAIVEGIAQRISDGEVPETLQGRRVVQLDLSGVVAGTRYRGDFEERLNGIIDEIRGHENELIVFIDELHTVVGAGGSTEGGVDASNMLKPPLARGELHVVGATTLEEFRRYIEKDAALARRFQPVFVSEPTPDDTLDILRGLRDRYEAHHQVRFTDEALLAAVELSDHYLTEQFLPDKAIDLMDQTGARVRLRTKTPRTDLRALERRIEQLRRDKDQAVAVEQYERATQMRDQIDELTHEIEQARSNQPSDGVPEVTAEDIAEVVARRTGIPVSRLTQQEKERLLGLEEQLHQRLVGQNEAVSVVAEAVRRSRAGLGDPKRPVGSFLFLGPTGVGKTELARALAESLFGSEDRMVRLDMSEYQERHTVSRLVGAPPGYVGHEEAGQLTEAVRRQPYTLLLLDEIEKAHPDVFNLLLQVLDDGRLTDAQGRTVDFKNTVLIMTSNLGSELITGRGSLGFSSAENGSENERRDRVMRVLRESFRPEFLNRIDEIVVFKQLDADELRQITDLLLESTRRRLHGQSVDISFADEAVNWLAEHGFQPEFGARPLRRTIQREVDNPLSKLLLDGELSAGDHVEVDVDHDNDRLAFRVRHGAGEPVGV